MNCPVCEKTELKMTERQGVEIDYCPQCRGVWLDRGELDKIIERSNLQAPSQERSYPEYESRDMHRDDDHQYKQHGRHHKKSWLQELFD